MLARSTAQSSDVLGNGTTARKVSSPFICLSNGWRYSTLVLSVHFSWRWLGSVAPCPELQDVGFTWALGTHRRADEDTAHHHEAHPAQDPSIAFVLPCSHSSVLFATLPSCFLPKLAQFVLHMAESQAQWLSFSMPSLLVAMFSKSLMLELVWSTQLLFVLPTNKHYDGIFYSTHHFQLLLTQSLSILLFKVKSWCSLYLLALNLQCVASSFN